MPDDVDLTLQQLDNLTAEVIAPTGPGSEAWEAERSHTRRFNEKFIEEFRANNGNVPGELGALPLMLVTTTGARSGKQRTVPVAYFHVDGRHVSMASMGGADRNPPWFHNLVANPEVTIEMPGGDTFRAIASVPEGEDRQHLFDGVVEQFGVFDGYQERTERLIPVVEFTRLDD